MEWNVNFMLILRLKAKRSETKSGEFVAHAVYGARNL
jgi:hypothetical protein